MFEKGSVQQHRPDCDDHLAAPGDQGGFSRKSAFLLRLDEGLYAVRLGGRAASDRREVEVFAEPGVALPGDVQVEARAFPGLGHRRVQPGVGHYGLPASESGDVAELVKVN